MCRLLPLPEVPIAKLTPSCPAPNTTDRIQLGHGGGGAQMHRFLRDEIAPRFGAEVTRADAAVLPGGLALTTDSYVVSPLFFPGGDIGRLAVFGTINDLAMVGAEPLGLSLSLIVEEGTPLDVVGRVLDSVQQAAIEAGVPVVTGDTKVVERGKGDQVFVNTSGVGRVPEGTSWGSQHIAEGDNIVVSGDLGRHGMAVMACREGLEIGGLESDCACLLEATRALRTPGVHCLRDLTRGGLASALVELSRDAGLRFELDEAKIPLSEAVQGASELLGLDVLQLANEGRFVAFVTEEQTETALASLRETGQQPTVVGRVVGGQPQVWLRGMLGQLRVVELVRGELLPRIC